jgi:hypothetical protein
MGESPCLTNALLELVTTELSEDRVPTSGDDK